MKNDTTRNENNRNKVNFKSRRKPNPFMKS